MPSVVHRHGLPAALAARLSDETRAAYEESGRDARFRLLAQGLGLDEAGLLKALSDETGLPVLDEPAADPEGVKILPARLAGEAQVVPVRFPGAEEGRLHLASPLPPDPDVADWVAT
ncbi:MAG: hypothetical protein ACK467_05850, partial [Opitutia bacterium]